MKERRERGGGGKGTTSGGKRKIVVSQQNGERQKTERYDMKGDTKKKEDAGRER
jgi:hypothetical protein